MGVGIGIDFTLTSTSTLKPSILVEGADICIVQIISHGMRVPNGREERNEMWQDKR